MTELQNALKTVTENLSTLKERAAKYAGSTPLDLLNQIRDHEQAIAGEITRAEWRDKMGPLLVSLNREQVVIKFDVQQTAFDQQGQTVGIQVNVAGPLNIYSQPPLPRPPDPAILAAAEQRYCQRLKDRYAADAPFYIPLAGETTEQDSGPLEAAAPRSAHRGQKRALAEYCEWIQIGQELKRVKRKWQVADVRATRHRHGAARKAERTVENHMDDMYDRICSWDNLRLAHGKAARGKRGKPDAAAFEYDLATAATLVQQLF